MGGGTARAGSGARGPAGHGEGRAEWQVQWVVVLVAADDTQEVQSQQHEAGGVRQLGDTMSNLGQNTNTNTHTIQTWGFSFKAKQMETKDR